MKHDDDFTEWRFKRVDNSKPPLRWIANGLGSIATFLILKAFDAQDSHRYDLSMFYSKISNPLLKFYNKYGTFYQANDKEDYE